jgi:hypothetical protein
MQPAPMICEFSLDLAVAAKQKQVGCVAMRVCRNALIQKRVASYSSWARPPHPPRGMSEPSLHQLSSVTYAAGADVCEVSLDFAFVARLTQIGCVAPDDM